MSVFLEKAESYALDYLNNNLEKKFVYHSIAHTQRVVEKAKELGESEKIEGEDLEALIVSAWFHDTGYSKSLTTHEEESVGIASEFLKEEEKEDLIPKVSEAILATRMSAIPETLVGKVLRDADCSHLGSKNYDEFSELLRKELELTKNISFSDSNS